MLHHVIVSFGKEKEFKIKITSGTSPAGQEARQWFDHKFTVLECDVATPTGKILAVDRILSVAKYAGEHRFRDQRTWAEQFAKNTAALLGRELIRVDVEHAAASGIDEQSVCTGRAMATKMKKLEPSLKLPVGNAVTTLRRPVMLGSMRDELDIWYKRERPHIVEIVAWAASNWLPLRKWRLYIWQSVASGRFIAVSAS